MTARAVPEPLLKIRQALATHQLLFPRARVVVAVSGGADSVALLHALVSLRPAWKLVLHVAHLDHGLRDGSREDAAFVRALAAAWDIPCTAARQDVRAACERGGWSLEDGARRVRYAFLLGVANEQRASHIALAHTADDQAETVLMRLVRGCGIVGLSGIPVKRRVEETWIVRPLLDVWRREVLAYLTDAGLTFREDPSNRDLRFVRNRIRHELLPLLERNYNPNIKQALTQLAEQNHWDAAYLQDAAGRQWKRAVKLPTASHGRREAAISIAAFQRQPKAIQRQLMRQAVQRVHGETVQLEFRHWVEAERLFAARPVGTRVDLPGGVQLRREKERVICARTTD